MSMHAKFFKRLFSAIIDITLVIIVTWLLYLFPFQMIIGKQIDSDYKNNIKKPYDAITEEYSGEVSYFGKSTKGKFETLLELSDQGYMSEADFARYQSIEEIGLSDAKIAFDRYYEMLKNEDYDPEKAPNKQMYSYAYQVYQYASYIYTVYGTFPMNDEFVLYDETFTKEGVSKDEQESILKTYNENNQSKYAEICSYLLQAMNAYEEKNGCKIKNTQAYKQVEVSYQNATRQKSSSLGNEYTDEMHQEILNYINKYEALQNATQTVEKQGTTTVEGTEYVKVSKLSYYLFYYDLAFEQFNAQLPYYSQIYEHTNWAIIYSLAMFTLVYSIYTVVMRGQTLGRRAVRIKLTDGHEREKLNPVLALLHDVPFKFLYLLIIGLYSLVFTLAAIVVFTIVDALMIRFDKNHRNIRDYLSGTRVIESPLF